MFCFSWISDFWSLFLLVGLKCSFSLLEKYVCKELQPICFLHVYFSYSSVMFSNQTDPTGKFMNLVIPHCVIVQERYIVIWHMVFEVVACLLCRIYILVLFQSSDTYYNCQFRTWIFLGFMNNAQVSYFTIFWSIILLGCILYSRSRIGHLKYMRNHVMIK
jgi:hypothetical protein